MILLKHRKIILNVFLYLFLLSGSLITAQKAQRIAYIDMEYILENVPEYLEAQNTLDSKVTKWRSTLDKLSRFIEKSKTDLANEREILTNDLILEKEDEITLKQEELRRLENLYFGPNGDMFLLRKQLVKPIQDQVYNSLEDIVLKRKYDFVFDKSSDLVMLYSNKKYDISDLVLNEIVRERKIKVNKEKKAKKRAPKKLTDRQQKVIKDREAAVKKKEEERLAKKKKIEEARKKRIADIEEKRRVLKEKKDAIKKKKEKGNNDQNNN
jgi:Skp family chaperone for outer membrane proteins